jgi:hypothetical protein
MFNPNYAIGVEDELLALFGLTPPDKIGMQIFDFQYSDIESL